MSQLERELNETIHFGEYLYLHLLKFGLVWFGEYCHLLKFALVWFGQYWHSLLGKVWFVLGIFSPGKYDGSFSTFLFTVINFNTLPHFFLQEIMDLLVHFF